MKLSIRQETDLGRGKIKAIRVAKLLKTCLTRIPWPAKERSLDFHPESLEWNLSSREEKWFFLGVPMIRGAPRYWEWRGFS